MAGNQPGADATDTASSLVDAAEACFADWGVAKTSMGDVARRAGLSRPTLYRYFADRDALTVAVVMRRSRRLVSRAQRHLGLYPDLATQIVEGLIFLVDRGRKDQIVQEVISGGSAPGATERLTRSSAAHSITKEVWEPVLERGRQRGELRTGTTMDDALTWLVYVQVVLISSLGTEPTDAQWAHARALIRGFVLPAFVAPPVEPRS